MTRSRPSRLVAGVLAGLAIGAVLAGCARTAEVDQRVLHSVMLGTDEVIDASASSAVDRVGLRLRVLGPSLGAALADPAGAAALARLEEDVAGLAAEVAAAPAVVRRGFDPYVLRWREVVEATEGWSSASLEGDERSAADALDAIDAALARLAALDRGRIDRVVEAFGEEEASRLLELEVATGA